MEMKDKSFQRLFLFILVIFIVGSAFALDIKLLRYKLFIMEVCIILMMALCLIKAFIGGDIVIKKSPLYLPIFLYIGLVIVYYLVSGHKAIASVELSRVLLSSGIFLAVCNGFFRVRDLVYLVWIWIISATIIGLYGFGQYLGGFWIFKIPLFTRPSATFGNPDFYATYLVISIALGIGLLLYLERFRKIYIIPTIFVLILNL
jgi:hypothetical protein